MFPQYFTRYDWSRSYVLPAGVATTVPRSGSVGMLGAHNAARGLLVEICRHTSATPLALDYRETELPGGDIVVDVVATARRPDGTSLTVTTSTRSRRRPPDRLGDWTLTIDGVTEELRVRPPSPPVQGYMVDRLTRREPVAESERSLS